MHHKQRQPLKRKTRGPTMMRFSFFFLLRNLQTIHDWFQKYKSIIKLSEWNSSYLVDRQSAKRPSMCAGIVLPLRPFYIQWRCRRDALVYIFNPLICNYVFMLTQRSQSRNHKFFFNKHDDNASAKALSTWT